MPVDAIHGATALLTLPHWLPKKQYCFAVCTVRAWACCEVHLGQFQKLHTVQLKTDSIGWFCAQLRDCINHTELPEHLAGAPWHCYKVTASCSLLPRNVAVRSSDEGRFGRRCIPIVENLFPLFKTVDQVAQRNLPLILPLSLASRNNQSTSTWPEPTP